MLNRLDTILPPDIISDTLTATTKLLPAILLRANFIPGVRQRLGWRGIKECANDSFSIKISDRDGVYGLSFAATESGTTSSAASFDLHYFPAPDEETLEQYSIAACIAALQDDYLEQVRDFNRHELLKNLFHVARITLTLNSNCSSLSLSIRAEEELVLISADGVTVVKDGAEEQVVAPGEVDQQLAAYTIAYDFFRILAASFSFCLGAAPQRLTRRSKTASEFIYSRDNHREERTGSDNKELDLALNWGADTVDKQIDIDNFTTELCWAGDSDIPAQYANEPWWQETFPGAHFSIDKSTMGITERPKLIVLTGFLGSGKTSFLNHFIEYQAERNAFVAIVQNEIGARNLDTRLLGQHYAVTEMDEGCICCSLAGNLKLALSEIASGFQPDFIVVETTGLANPANFLSEIVELEDQLDFCSVTTVIDASQGLSTLDNYEVAHEQVALADILLINKADEIPPERLEILQSSITSMNPHAQIHIGNHGDFSIPELYGVNLTGHARLAESLDKLKTAHHHTHADNRISSTLLEFKQPLDKKSFLSTTSNLPNQVLRIKGVVQFTDCDQPYYYQYVPGSYSLTPATDEAAPEAFLVVIGEDIHNNAASLCALATG